MAEGDLPIRGPLVLPARELHWRFSRSSGPGGQGVNTADSRVELSFDLGRSPSFPPHLRERAERRLAARLVDGVLTVVASEHRSQLRNREAARERLAATLREATGPGPARHDGRRGRRRVRSGAGSTPRPVVERSSACAAGRPSSSARPVGTVDAAEPRT